MALSKANAEYVDGFGLGHGKNKDFTDSLKEVLTDATVVSLKSKMKDKEIASLNVKKESIDAQITELNK